MNADRQRLRQVLVNLLSNAVKYDRSGGSLTVAARLERDHVRITVSDTGPGIAPELLPRLFKPFERLGAEQQGIEGTGIGLALSKRLVELMGGVIGVESEPGRGSTFWVLLRVASDQPVPPRPADLPAPTTDAVDATGLVLYVEDNVANFELVQGALRTCPGVRLRHARTGGEALAAVAEELPGLVLLDLHLPDRHGREVLSALRSDPTSAAVPVVVVSADATPGQAARLRAVGASDYLTKPIDVRRLLEVVSESLGSSGRAQPAQPVDEGG